MHTKSSNVELLAKIHLCLLLDLPYGDFLFRFFVETFVNNWTGTCTQLLILVLIVEVIDVVVLASDL